MSKTTIGTSPRGVLVLILISLAVRVTFEALEKSRGDRNRKTFNIMYSLSFLIVELETARTALLDVFEVSNGTPNWTWHGRHLRMGCAAGLASHLAHYFGRPISKIEDKVRWQ
jgi:hypothetical protein